MTVLGTSPRTLKPQKFKSDPKNSTFRWECDMTDDGINRVPQIEGYSKGIGFELTNKAELLIKKLENPLLTYLQKSDEIRVYENLIELPSGQTVMQTKDRQKLLVVLTRKQFSTLDWVSGDAVIEHRLQELYDHLEFGTVAAAVTTGRRKNVWFDELSHTKYDFASVDELNAFCRSMAPKYGTACMHKWHIAHLAMQPNLTKPKEVINVPAGLTPEQEAAKNSLQGLYSKYKKQ